MNNKININPSSTKWLEKDDRVVADYFCDLGFRSLKQILDMRVFDLMNMQGLNAVRVEEVIICLYKWLNPNTAIDEAMLSENKKRMVVAICAEEEISSIEWARLKKDKWVNRSISCPEYVQSIYKMMNWNKECRYKIYGRLANSERGLVLVFDLVSAVMFDPLPEEYFDKHTGKMKKRIVKYYPDEIRMKLGRSYSDYEALQQRSSFESLSGYMDTSGGAVPATVSEELAASISMQEQEKKRETLFGTIIGNGGDDDVRNNE